MELIRKGLLLPVTSENGIFERITLIQHPVQIVVWKNKCLRRTNSGALSTTSAFFIF
jgi:hypothetical protein